MLKEMREKQIITSNDMDRRLMHKPLWDLGITGEGVTVAVLDTGINRTSDLENVLSTEFDFTGGNDPNDWKNEHGTKVAHAINYVAPKAMLANFKVLSEKKPANRETVCEAIQYCIDEYPKYRLINLSLEFYPKDCTKKKRCLLCSMVNDAFQKGIFIVTAAGNQGPKNGTLQCPGLAEESLTVVSTQTSKERLWWDNIFFLKKIFYKISGQYGQVYGTSYSAGYASGGVALLLSEFNDFHPIDIKEAILESTIEPTPGVIYSQPELAYKLLMDKRMNNNLVEKKDYLIPRRYYKAKQNLVYAGLGAILVDEKGNLYGSKEIKKDIELTINYNSYLIKNKKYVNIKEELQDIISYINKITLQDNVSSTYKMRIMDLLDIVEHNLINSNERSR